MGLLILTSAFHRAYISPHDPARPFGGKALLFDEISGREWILSYSEAAVLSRFDRFRSLEDHIARITAETGPRAASLVKAAVEKLLEKGLLLSREDFLWKLAEDYPAAREGEGPFTETNTDQVESLVWVTADRPEKLTRSVETFSVSCLKQGRKPRFAVYDDSRDTESAGKTKKLFIEIMEKYGLSPGRDHRGAPPFLYVGPREKAQFRERLVKELSAGPGMEAVLDFALSGAAGANRNFAFLHRTGQCFISTDDDTEARFARHPGRENGIEFCSEQDPTEFFLYPHREWLLKDVHIEDINIIGEHEKLLGRRAADILLGARDTVLLGRAAPAALRRLLRTGGRVLTTLSGICGDSGMTHSRIVLTWKGARRDKAFNGEGYKNVRLFRETLRVVPHTVLSTGQFYMSTHTGFDNRWPLPPFFPQFRSADGLFGFMLPRIFEEGVAGFLPWAVYHNPEGKRTTPEAFLSTWKFGVADTVALLMEDYQTSPGPASREDRIAALGRYLVCMASMGSEDLLKYIRERSLPHTADYLNILANRLDEFGRKPEPWARDVETMMSYIEEHVGNPDFFLPAELRDGSEPLVILERLRELVRRYGELLTAWPDIWHAAKRIHHAG